MPSKNTSVFNFSKKPSPFPTYQIPSNTPPAKSPSYFPLPPPSKLPNSLSNLSQNKNPLPNSLSGPNRTPQPYPATFKPEPLPTFYTDKQYSQKVTNKVVTLPPLPNPSKHQPELVPTFYTDKQPSQKVTNKLVTLPPLPSAPKHQNIETPVLYAYKILSADAGRPDRFGSTNVRYSLQSSPVTAPGKPFETALSVPTFTIAQNRPYSFQTKSPSSPHFLTAKEELDEDVDNESVLLEKVRQLQPKLDGFNMHSNFARAIADRPKNATGPAISVVLSTSSVSSSISSKPHSAISNVTGSAARLPGLHQKSQFAPHQNQFANHQNQFAPHQNVNSFTSSIPSSTLAMLKSSQPNITEINDSLTEEQPYYEEDANVEYDENLPEYKDILYHSDVKKIKQR